MLPRIKGLRSCCLPLGPYTEEDAWPVRERLVGVAEIAEGDALDLALALLRHPFAVEIAPPN